MKKILAVLVLPLLFAGAVAWAAPVHAQGTAPVDCPDGVPTSIEVNGSRCIPTPEGSQDINQNPIFVLLREVIRFMTLGVGLVVVGGLVYGGILYAWSRDNASQTKQAIDIIRNSIVGLLLYIGMFAILNFLIPGGVLT